MVIEELVGEWCPPPDGGGLPIPDTEFIKQIRTNCKLDLPNLNTEPEHDKIMIMVCGGPSAKFYIEEIRKKSIDDKYRIFCSNKTHDWLIENDIIPDVQFIIDPKESKLEDIKNPHKDVHYMIGVQCHPDLFKKLKDYKVTRILTYCNISDENDISDMQIINAIFNKKDFTPLDGGTMAGLRAMTLANILGYTTVEFYGFDSCFFDYDKEKLPIYYSYEKQRKENVLECKTDDGRIFLSTPVFASQARQFIKWKHKLGWIKFIIHGDSLTAHINKLDEETSKPKHNRLISEYMLKMNQALHKELNVNYGNIYASEHAGPISVLAGQLIRKFGELTLLDYGCGKGILAKILPPISNLTVTQYDPCIDEYSQRPQPADIVVCTDVLEHVELDCLENVLDDLKNLTKKTCYISICTEKALKSYSDGQNCHLIVEDIEWWYPKLRKRFNIIETQIKKDKRHNHFICIAQAKEIK